MWTLHFIEGRFRLKSMVAVEAKRSLRLRNFSLNIIGKQNSFGEPFQMPSSSKSTWNLDNVLDDIECSAEDRQTFENLISETNVSSVAIAQQPDPGAILKGRIVELTRDYVVIDVGLKSEGLIPLSEFRDSAELVLDSEIEVLLERPENERGQIVLSRERAEKQRQWEHILEKCTEGSIVRGQITRKVKGGLMVDIGIEAFLPGSQIDNKRVKDLDKYLNETYDLKIIKINQDRRNVVVSRRELLEAERVQRKAQLLETIQQGDVRRGAVKNITDFGVFLDLEGIDGLLHITDMTWRRIKHPSEVVQLGDELEVMILHIDRDKGRVALGLKQLEQNPWEAIEAKYPIGTKVQGRITNLVTYGAFMEIEPGIEGLIHNSEMSWVKNVADPNEVVSKGDELEAIVLSVQRDEGKISLGLKQTGHNPWHEVSEKYPIGKSFPVEVKSLTNYGAFVELEPGVEGLVHVSDLSWTKKVANPNEVVKKGDQIECIILSVDIESKKITLGLKQLSDNPWTAFEKIHPPGSPIKGTIIKTTAFGAFVEIEGGLEGLIHVTELSDQSISRVEDIVAKGQEVEATIVKIDPEHRRIALTLRKENINRED